VIKIAFHVSGIEQVRNVYNVFFAFDSSVGVWDWRNGNS